MVDLKQIRQTAQADFKKAEDVVVAEEVKAASWLRTNWYEAVAYAALAVIIAIVVFAVF